MKTGAAGDPGRAAFQGLFVVVAVEMLIYGIMEPVFPRLLVQLQGGDLSKGATLVGLSRFSWAAMQFVFAPLLGALSDRFGRRPVILVSVLGLVLDSAFMAFVPLVGWLVLARLFTGVTSAMESSAWAFVADVTAPEKRAARYGYLGAAFGVGFTIGPAIGGFLGEHDLRLPFLVCAGLGMANACYACFFLKESLPVESRVAFSWKRAHPLSSLKMLGGHPRLLLLAGIILLHYVAHEALPSLFVLYTGYRYHWDGKSVGLALATVSVMAAIVSTLLIPQALRRLGERGTLGLGLLFGMTAFAIFGLAPTGRVFLVGLPCFSLWWLAGPVETSLISREVSGARQGELQGALSSMRALTAMAAPVVFTQAFAAAVGARADETDGAGAPFLIAGAVLALAIVLTGFAKSRALTQPAAQPDFI